MGREDACRGLRARHAELRRSIDFKSDRCVQRGPIANGHGAEWRSMEAHLPSAFRDPDHFFEGADRSGCAQGRDLDPAAPNGFVSANSDPAHDCRRASRLTNANPTWERNMPKILRHEFTQRTHNDWAIAIPVGLVIAGLLGFLAFYPKRTHMYPMPDRLKPSAWPPRSRSRPLLQRNRSATKRPLKTGSATARQTNLPSIPGGLSPSESSSCQRAPESPRRLPRRPPFDGKVDGVKPSCTASFSPRAASARCSQPRPDRISLAPAWPDQPAGAYPGRM